MVGGGLAEGWGMCYKVLKSKGKQPNRLLISETTRSLLLALEL